jgi:hypothetical protein
MSAAGGVPQHQLKGKIPETLRLQAAFTVNQTPALEAGGPALVSRPSRTGTYHPHFHVLLIVPAKYFDPGSPFYIG